MTENSDITELEREISDMETKLGHMFFHYYRIEDPERQKSLFSEILDYVRKLLMKNPPKIV